MRLVGLPSREYELNSFSGTGLIKMAVIFSLLILSHLYIYVFPVVDMLLTKCILEQCVSSIKLK